MRNKVKNVSKKIIASIVSFCLIITLAPVQALAVEGTTFTVTLKNYDGAETLSTLIVDEGTVLTQTALNAEVDELDIIRGGYFFMGWALTAGEVTSSYIPAASFTINETTTLYTVHRPLEASDLDSSAGVAFLNNLSALDSTLSELGYSAQELSNAPQKSDVFYSYLENYYNTNFETQNSTSSYSITRSTTSSASADRYTHAIADAINSKTSRSDLNLAKEVVYMYTSHYIDIEEPFNESSIDHDSRLYQYYITDLDRRTYDTFYTNSSHWDTFQSMLDFISAIVNADNFVSDASSAFNLINTKVLGIWSGVKAIDYGISTWKDVITAQLNTAYFEISAIDLDSNTDLAESEMYTLLDELTESIEANLVADLGDFSHDAAIAIMDIAITLVLSTPTLSTYFVLTGFYSDFITNIIDRAYFVNMRAYIQTRVGERMMFALGMTDGRN